MSLYGCANTGSFEGRPGLGLFPGTSTVPELIANDVYLIQGWDTQTAIKGGRNKCALLEKQFSMLQITPSTQQSRATMTFRCI
jgi:hypothetical protein